MSIYKGAVFALAASLLFGASTPFSKILLSEVHPVLLAGLLYLGSGIGLGIWWAARKGFSPFEKKEEPLKAGDVPWILGSIFSGGVVGPVLLMWGLFLTPASTASLLLNLEGVMTALLAWFWFREHFGRRIVTGMLAICAGGLLLSWPGRAEPGSFFGPVFILGACFAWGFDNNLTQKISGRDPIQVAGIKGLAAGLVNGVLAIFLGVPLPSIRITLLSGTVGLLGIGLSLVLFVYALRFIGTARTSSYFSTAPFAGAFFSIVMLGEPVTLPLLAASVFMGMGVWLHLTEDHDHEHFHGRLEHEHWHGHDVHHDHDHPEGREVEPHHSHLHVHFDLLHSHPHFPDTDHRHSH